MDIKQLVNNQTHASITLADHLCSKKCPNTHIVFSPLSINVALSFIAAGSNGQSTDMLPSFLKTNAVHDPNSTLSSQLVSLIMSDGSSSGGPRLSFANRVWVEHTRRMKTSFKQILDTVYNAPCKQVDFRTKATDVVNEVNLWAETQTGGLIKNVLPPDALHSFPQLVFANAVYFKGVWNQKFDPSNTKDLPPFHLLDGSKVELSSFMPGNYEQLVGEDKRHFTMCLSLPDEKNGHPYLIEKMCSSDESDFLDHHHMPHQRREVGQFCVPKKLKELSLALFPTTGGLTEIVEYGDLDICVSKIYHKSFVEVNEDGTEATAVTVTIALPLITPW